MQQESGKQIFREKALEKAFATDELDRMMQVTKPTGWLALLVMGIIIGAALAWGLLGQISIKVAASGIILDDGGAGREKAVLFLPLADKDRVKPGMAVQLSPAGFPSQSYGYLLGAVKDVSRHPLTSQNMADILLENEALVAMFSSGGPQVMVTVELKRDTRTGGYAWTDPAGEAVTISSETLCRGDIIVDEKRPVALLVPR